MSSSRRALLGATLGLGVLSATGVRAQLAVIDPTGLVQLIKQVQQGLQQVQALQSQLAQQAKMLQGLGVDVTGPVAAIAAQATSLLKQSQGLGYQAATISQGFSDLYPSDLKGLSATDLAARLSSWSQSNRQTLQEALQVQNQIAQAQATTSGAVGAAVSASQTAAGQTAAVQATNQLLAVLSTQLTQLQTLLITQARQAQTLEAERQGLAAKGEADRERQSALAPYTPTFNKDRF
ncbi:conjugal transfer protein TrbJ [Caulobacter hibisci]|uniref:Conjugal transfer protein TrbJ n=1 Tax=Caulobacter hibisci TaxID=2035993 RepID=A0ABS0SX38_9CAUL|nr:conjugal transfer protein TrbJ [Caulobacter hibisci]MBI1684205.1 conjugal transfer protein TrbJ [Caulobacter hibisci]